MNRQEPRATSDRPAGRLAHLIPSNIQTFNEKTETDTDTDTAAREAHQS